MRISLLDMGRIKKRNVREAVISILSKKYPLSIKKIYNSVKKEYALSVTYQAVFKVIKEMIEDGILEVQNREYKLNLNWITQLEEELDIIKSNYEVQIEKSGKRELQERINLFVSEIGPKLKNYIGKDEVTLLSKDSVSRLYASSMYRYLVREGVKISYLIFNEFEFITGKYKFKKEHFTNKKVIVIDSSIYSGNTYNNIMERLNNIKNKYKIKDIKYAVDKDLVGLADFSRI